MVCHENIIVFYGKILQFNGDLSSATSTNVGLISPCRFSLEYQRGRPMENMVVFPRVTFQKGITYRAQALF